MGGAVSIGMGRRECRAVGADAAPLVPDRGAGSIDRWGQPRAERFQQPWEMDEG